MPNERVTHDEHPMLLAERDKSIRRSKIVLFRLRVDEGPLQNILRSDAVEMFGHKLGATGILFKDLAVVESRPDAKVVLKDLFQYRLLRRDRRRLR